MYGLIFRAVVLLLAAMWAVSAAMAQPVLSSTDARALQEKLAAVIAEVHGDLELGEVLDVDQEAIPDFSDFFQDDKFEGGRQYIYLFRSKAPADDVWAILKDFERQDSFPNSPIKEIEKLGEVDGEVAYRMETDTILGTKTQYTLARAFEEERIVYWRADPDKENSLEYSNGFWAVQEWGDGETVVACYSRLSIGWLKGRWAKSTQRGLAEATRAAVEQLHEDRGDVDSGGSTVE